jgi:DNA-binding FadR family transcriptional regulator
MLTTIPGAQITKQVQEQVAAFVASEGFKSGDRLPSLRELTETLGVSRPSVREGLRALEALGIIEIKHGSGIYVAGGMPPIAPNAAFSADSAIGAQAAREILAVRLSVEPEVSALAALHATDEDLAKLGRDVDEFRRDFGKMTNPPSDAAFHIDLCRASHNNAFLEIMKWIAQFYAKDAKRPEAKDVDDHARIFAAVMNRDSRAARREMTRHLTWIGEVMEKRLQKNARGRREK